MRRSKHLFVSSVCVVSPLCMLACGGAGMDGDAFAREATATRAERLGASVSQNSLGAVTATNSAASALGSAASATGSSAAPAARVTTASSVALNTTAQNASSIRPMSFVFDGVSVTGDNVDQFAAQPVIAFGQPLDSNGHALAGELWLIVEKQAKTVYYHLTEEHASGTGSYAGHTVKLKAVSSYSMVNYGSGEDVPYVGNADDAFVIANTELSGNSKFYGPSTQCMAGAGNPCTPSYNMLALGSSVSISNVPASLSAMRKSALQLFAPDGSLVDEWSAGLVASGSGSTSCQDFANGVVSTVESVQDAALGVGQGGMKLLNAGAFGAAGGIAGAAAGSGVASAAGAVFGGGSGVLVGMQISDSIVNPITNAIQNGAQYVTSPVVSGLAKGACNLAQLGDDLLASLDDLDLGNTDVEDCGAQTVCDSIGTQQIGSVATTGQTTLDDGSVVEEVTVSPVDGEVCTDSHVEFSCVTG